MGTDDWIAFLENRTYFGVVLYIFAYYLFLYPRPSAIINKKIYLIKIRITYILYLVDEKQSRYHHNILKQ